MLIAQAKEGNGHNLKPGSLANIDFIPSLFGADSSHTKYVNQQDNKPQPSFSHFLLCLLFGFDSLAMSHYVALTAL